MFFHFKSAQINPRPPKWVGWFILFWFSKIWKDWLCCTCGSMAKPLGEAIPTRQKISSLRYMSSRSGKAEDLVRWKEGLLMDSIWMFFWCFFCNFKVYLWGNSRIVRVKIVKRYENHSISQICIHIIHNLSLVKHMGLLTMAFWKPPQRGAPGQYLGVGWSHFHGLDPCLRGPEFVSQCRGATNWATKGLVGWLVGWVRECQSLYGGLFHKAWNNKDPYETTSVMESKRVFSWLKYRRLQVPNVVKQMNNEKKIMVFPVRGDLYITSLGEIPPIPLTWHWHRQQRTFLQHEEHP